MTRVAPKTRALLVVVPLLIGATLSHAAAAAPLKIMPLGDSITEGWMASMIGHPETDVAGYRGPLYEKLTAAGHSVQFVGSNTTFPGSLPADQRRHEGHSGWMIAAGTAGTEHRDGLTNHINDWLGPNGADPDVILLMVGANDVWLDYQLSTAPDRLNGLITRISDKTTGLKPDAKLIVAKISPFAEDAIDARAQLYNAAVANVVARHRALGENVSLVDMHAALDRAAGLSDLVHPNAVGYRKIADVWFEGVKAATAPEPSAAALLLSGLVAAILLAFRRLRAIGPCLLLAILCPQRLSAVEFPSPIDYQAIVSRSDLVYSTPAATPVEGHPIGNGQMGTMVWTTPGAIELQINRNDVFAVNKDHVGKFDYQDNTTDYGGGCARVSVNVGSQAFSGNGFSQRLSLYNAEDTIQGNGVAARCFVTSNNVLMLEVDDRRATPQPLQVDVSMWRAPVVTNGAHTAAYTFQNGPQTATLSQQFTENAYYCGSAVAVQAEGAAGVVQTSDRCRSITVAAASGKRLIQISSAASWDKGVDLAAAANANLTAVTGKSYDALRSEHTESWNELWSRSSVNLSSPDGIARQAERQRNLQLYYMASSSRGPVPPKWNGSTFCVNGDARTWGSQYWVWTTESSYYPLYAADAVALTNPFYSMYLKQLPAAKEAARQRWGASGAFYPETTPFDGPVVLPENIAQEFRQVLSGQKPVSQMSAAAKAACGFEGHLFETVYDAKAAQYSWISHVASSGSELAAQAWIRYRYTGDASFLQSNAYPLLRESLEFYRSIAKKGDDGLYHLQRLNQHEDFWGVDDGIMDLAAIRGTAPLAIRASEILGVDGELRTRWQDFLDHLAPYPMGSDPRSKALTGGVLADDVWSAGHLGDVNGQHNPEDVWLNTIFPFEDWTIETHSPTQDAIVRKLMDLAPKTASVLNGGTLNTALRTPIAAARSGRSDLLPAILKKYSEAFSPLANGMSLFEGANAQSTEHLGIISTTVQDALLQSVAPRPGEQEVLNVFPAWPLQWNAEFSLLARGGFLVRSRCDSGAIDYVQIESRLGETCFLRNPWDGAVQVCQFGGPTWQLSGQILSFETQPGMRYLLTPVPEPSAVTLLGTTVTAVCWSMWRKR